MALKSVVFQFCCLLLALGMGASATASAEEHYATPYGERDDVSDYLDELVTEHQFER